MAFMQIEKSIPMPSHKGGFYKYPWEELSVGDSFFVHMGKITSVSSVANRAASRMGAKYKCATVVESGSPGVRVWRVK